MPVRHLSSRQVKDRILIYRAKTTQRKADDEPDKFAGELRYFKQPGPQWQGKLMAAMYGSSNGETIAILIKEWKMRGVDVAAVSAYHLKYHVDGWLSHRRAEVARNIVVETVRRACRQVLLPRSLPRGRCYRRAI